MKKESDQTKSITVVKRRSMMVCPKCGHDDFKKKDGFSLLGQQFTCAKCGYDFRKPARVGAKTTSVQVDKHGRVAGSGGRKHDGRRRGRR